MREIFTAHLDRYPAMLPQDAVKLAYQSVYGAGHLVALPDTARERVKAEFLAAEAVPRPLLEEIGGGRARLHLNSSDCKAIWLDSICFLFTLGAKPPAAGPDALDGPLEELKALTAAGQAPFSPQALTAFLSSYDAAGRPMVRHTQAYRAAYSPAYRVMEGALVRLFPAFAAIDQRLEEKDRVVVAVDGMAAAGKTTLAAMLQRRYDCQVIHMDDFFLPPALRTPARLACPGGNIHHERFREQVLAGLAAGKAFSYQVFDCHQMTCTARKTVKPNRLTVIEGSYALHPALRQAYDLKLFYPVEEGEQLRRLRARDGEAGLAVFRERWIPLENTYIAACGVRECADLIL